MKRAALFLFSLLLSAMVAHGQVQAVDDAVGNTIAGQHLAEKIAQGLDRLEEWEEQFKVLTTVKDQAEDVAHTIRKINEYVSDGVFYAQYVEQVYFYIENLKLQIASTYETLQHYLNEGKVSFEEAEYILNVVDEANVLLFNSAKLASSALTPDPKDPQDEQTRKGRLKDSITQAEVAIDALEKPMRLLVMEEAADRSREVQSEVFTLVHSPSDKTAVVKNATVGLVHQMSGYEKILALLAALLCMLYTGWNLVKVANGEMDFASGVKHVIISIVVVILTITIFAKIF